MGGNMFEYLLGALIISNGAIVLAILRFAYGYGFLKKQVEVNTKGVRDNGKRILDIERAL